MIRENERATAAAVAQSELPRRLYHRTSLQATAINEILAQLMFSIESPHTTATERSTVLGVVDDLIRLKIDAGLLCGGQS